jgi:hypothetical protein
MWAQQKKRGISKHRLAIQNDTVFAWSLSMLRSGFFRSRCPVLTLHDSLLLQVAFASSTSALAVAPSRRPRTRSQPMRAPPQLRLKPAIRSQMCRSASFHLLQKQRPRQLLWPFCHSSAGYRCAIGCSVICKLWQQAGISVLRPQSNAIFRPTLRAS